MRPLSYYEWMGPGRIKMVNGLKLGDLILHKGHIYRVKHFPTRDMVCADLIHENTAPGYTFTAPQSIKIPRRSVNTNFNNMIMEYIASDRNSVFAVTK
jgi:hypothetical protein